MKNNSIARYPIVLGLLLALIVGGLAWVEYWIVAQGRASIFSVGIPAFFSIVLLWFGIIRPMLRKMQATDEEKTKFISSVSHKLRTPLTGILWSAELLADEEKFTEKGAGYLNDIVYLAGRMNVSVKILLYASRIESGRVVVLPKSLDVVRLTNECLGRLRMFCERRGVTLLFHKQRQELVVITDGDALSHVLETIVGNAIEYTPRGGKVEVALEERGGSVLFKIKDAGIGIPKHEQARIFKKFGRASNAVQLNSDGAGLGLYVASELIKLLGGKVWFESEEGAGSTFYARIPVAAKTFGERAGMGAGQF